MNYKYLGIDIGGTNTKMALVTSNGEYSQVLRFKTEGLKPFSEFKEKLYQSVKNYLSDNNLDLESIEVGIACPNYSYVSQRIESPPNLSWDQVNLKQEMSELFKKDIFVENDANVAAIGEHLWGEARNCSDFACITVGTGIGSGIFVNSSLIRGYQGLASEIGHFIVEKNGRVCGCGQRGHLETYASVTGIKKSFFDVYQERFSYQEIIELVKNDDKALEVLDKTAHYFALSLSHLIHLMNLEKIILAGGGMSIGEVFRSMIEKKLRNIVMPVMRDSFDIVISKTTSEGAILGAAGLVKYYG